MSNVKRDALRLLDFVKAFNELKYKTRFNIKDLNKMYFNQIPAVHEYIRIGIKYADQLLQGNYPVDEREDVILSVKYAEISHPPKVPEILKGWLSYNINHWNEQPSHYPSIWHNREVDHIELFETNSSRVIAYETYTKSWIEWQGEEQEKEAARNVYFKLREIQSEIESTEATQELVLGNGILTQGNGDLFYPIVTQTVKIQLDTEANEVTVRNTSNDSRVEALALQQLSGVENISIQATGLQGLHPMDESDLFKALKEVAVKLTIRPITGVRMNFTDKLPGKSILFTMQPVFFIRPRTRAVGRLVNELKEQIEEEHVEVNDFLTQALSDVIPANENIEEREFSLEESLGRACGESKEVLFTKPANKEQLEIAEKVEKNGVVVVQGPPGTGKTHTIANLIGHFLSEGKTVLVTSEKGKALSVLKNQVEDQLQALCVYLNGENKNEAIQSVQQIQEYRTTHNTTVIQKDIEKYTRERSNEIDEIARIRKLIYQIRNKQVESISYDGKTYSPIDAAQFVTSHVGILDYIPGSVEKFNAFPLSEDDLQFLFETNETVSSDDEMHLSGCYPEIGKIITPDSLEEYIAQREALKKSLSEKEQFLSEKFSWNEENKQITGKNGKILLNHADLNAINGLKGLLRDDAKESLCPWKERIIFDSIKGEAYQKLWQELVEKIEQAYQYYEAHCIAIAKKNIQVEERFFSIDDHIQVLATAVDKMDENGKFGFWNNLFGNKYKDICACFSIAGHAIQSKTEGYDVLAWANFIELSRVAGSLWNQMMKDDDSVPTYEILAKQSANPLEPMRKIVPDIQNGLVYRDRYEKLMKLVPQAGFVLKNVVDYGQWDDSDTSIRHEIRFLQNKLPVYLNCYDIFQKIEKINNCLNQYQKYLSSVAIENQAWESFYSTFAEEDVETYQKKYADLVQLIKKESDYLRRKRILRDLHELAPGWSKAVQEREGILGGVQIPETIYDAWKWKQLDKVIKEINGVTLDELEGKLVAASEALMQTTSNLCEAKAWYSICKRINQTPSLGKALASWQLAIKKLGKGKSKNAPIYKQQVQDAMAECQRAIPVWIMPFYMTYDFLRPSENHFDIIIVDEASQSDLTAVATLQLADKVIVVGDDKQVSPTNIRIPTAEIEKLRKLYLGKDFPKAVYQIMDAESSLYDLASLQSQSIMLVEHFRCVPEIIGYSNWLSYAGQIKPLRPADSTSLRPAMVSCFVGGQRDEKGKINQKEADYIVALLQACCRNSAYDNQTFGVISLLGNQQAELINRLIAERIRLQEKEKHQIICGDAAQFQGDERDVIFLSMVDSTDNGPLRFRAMDEIKYQQRYNVAVSRAKNQLWIVHSLHKGMDLKIQDGLYDIRRSLLEYADNPSAFIDDDKIRENADSPFEVEVCQYLAQHGFDYTQQYPAGAYYIDIAMKGKKVAIECDGDRWHSTPEQVANDMERQTILERLGWQFIRIRGTKYYSNKEGTMKWVLNKLQELQVFPKSVKTAITVDAVTETIKTEAEKQLMNWAICDRKEDDASNNEGNKKIGSHKNKMDGSPLVKSDDSKATNISITKTNTYKNPQESSSDTVAAESKKNYGNGSTRNGTSDRDTKKPEKEVDKDTTGTKKKPTKKKPVYQGVIEVGKSRHSSLVKNEDKKEPKTETTGTKKGPITRTVIIGAKPKHKKDKSEGALPLELTHINWKGKVDQIIEKHPRGVTVKEIIESIPVLAKYKDEPFVKSAINSYLYGQQGEKFAQCDGIGPRKWRRIRSY